MRMAVAPAEFFVGMKCVAWPPDEKVTMEVAQDWFAGLLEGDDSEELYRVTVTTVGDDGVMKVKVDDDEDIIEDRHWFELYPIREVGKAEQQQQEQQEQPIQLMGKAASGAGPAGAAERVRPTPLSLGTPSLQALGDIFGQLPKVVRAFL